MSQTVISSPPLSTEIRQFNIPGDDIKDIFFTFNFDIQKIESKAEITFTLDLNPSLCKNEAQSSPPVNPEIIEYKFDSKKQYFFSHNTIEGYYVKGNIEIISFNNPIGQFDDNYKNFLFNISTGHEEDTPHNIIGLFELIDPSSSNSD